MNVAALFTCFVPAQYTIFIIPFQSGKIKKNERNCGCGVINRGVRRTKKEPHARL